ncbi:hypothetical protein EPYR_02629 [Erwinia pyrifoliae DSM 12163]|nr:hypothetical protein EJP617_23020 [Erwinia sp. Ejp617]CAY75009.1 hypothetical protein EPYR_02629 [Erwinia pyrifoliae DSM 12163]
MQSLTAWEWLAHLAEEAWHWQPIAPGMNGSCMRPASLSNTWVGGCNFLDR